MSSPPETPKIYHITHVRNLPRIIEHGGLWSDEKRIELDLDCEVVGLPDIKRPRLEQCVVTCHRDTRVGQYVPFYFCSRSVMLFILHMGNYPGLTYKGGQGPMVHLTADLRTTVEWANRNGRRWAFSDRNARIGYADYFARLDDLNKINWAAIGATDWRDPVVKEEKQAEFLLYEFFPWQLVERIGVLTDAVKVDVDTVLNGVSYRPLVSVERSWYY